jgi:hypothetical protein
MSVEIKSQESFSKKVDMTSASSDQNPTSPTAVLTTSSVLVTDVAGGGKAPPHMQVKFKNIVKKVVSQEVDDYIQKEHEDDAYMAKLRKGSVLGEIGYLNSRDRSYRQKLAQLEEENNRIGKAKSLGFNSIKAGLRKTEYEEFIRNSPLKPLITKLMPPQPEPDAKPPMNGRRSILIRMKTESSLSSSTNGIVLPPISASDRNLGLAVAAAESVSSSFMVGDVPKIDLLRKSFCNTSKMGSESPSFSPIKKLGTKGQLSIQDFVDLHKGSSKSRSRSRDSNDSDEFSGDKSRSKSFEADDEKEKEKQRKIIASEEKAAKEADDNTPRIPPIAPFLLHELQSDDLIARRFGWRKGEGDENHGGEATTNSRIGKSASEDFEVKKSPMIKKLGDLTPTGSMRQSIRGFLNGGGSGPNGGKDSKKGNVVGDLPGKLTRKATVANLMGNAQPAGIPGGQHLQLSATGGEENPENSILDHYSGLLYHDPISSGTWKDVNLPKRPKTPNALFSSSTQQTLAAGRNINAYRPWGPERKIDPLDALLERSMNNSLSSEVHEDDGDGEYNDDFFEVADHSHSRSSTGKSSRSSRPNSRNGGSRGNPRKSSNGIHYKDRHASLAGDHQNHNHDRNGIGKHQHGSNKSNNHRHHSHSPHHHNNKHHHGSSNGNRSRSHSTESRKGSAGEKHGGGRNSPHNSSCTPPRPHNSGTSSADGNRSRPRSRGRNSDDERGTLGLTVSISQESYLSHEGSSLVTNSLLSPSQAGHEDGNYEDSHFDMPPIPSNDESEYGSPAGSPSHDRRSHDLSSSTSHQFSSNGSPSHSIAKKRSPLVINFIKPPI